MRFGPQREGRPSPEPPPPLPDRPPQGQEGQRRFWARSSWTQRGVVTSVTKDALCWLSYLRHPELPLDGPKPWFHRYAWRRHCSLFFLFAPPTPRSVALVHLPQRVWNSGIFLQTFRSGKIGSERARLPRQRRSRAGRECIRDTGVLELDEGVDGVDGRVQEEPGSRSPRHGARWLGRGSEYQLEGTFVFLNFA